MKSKTQTSKRCSACGQKLPTGNAYKPRPMNLDSRLKRATSSLAATLRLIADQRGKSAARLALQKLTRDLALDE